MRRAPIEAVAVAGFVSGYSCGGPGEPCDALNRPYFRPFGYVTRGQLAKIVAPALVFSDTTAPVLTVPPPTAAEATGPSGAQGAVALSAAGPDRSGGATALS